MRMFEKCQKLTFFFLFYNIYELVSELIYCFEFVIVNFVDERGCLAYFVIKKKSCQQKLLIIAEVIALVHK